MKDACKESIVVCFYRLTNCNRIVAWNLPRVRVHEARASSGKAQRAPCQIPDVLPRCTVTRPPFANIRHQRSRNLHRLLSKSAHNPPTRRHHRDRRQYQHASCSCARADKWDAHFASNV